VHEVRVFRTLSTLCTPRTLCTTICAKS
jgi:hypothetical protein